MTDGEDQNVAWVSVADAARRSGLESHTVRQWYRTGRLPTQRRCGSHGAFLVPLAAVLALAEEPQQDTEEVVAELRRAEMALAACEQQLQAMTVRADESAVEIEFLRAQLTEGARERRALEDGLVRSESDLGNLRRVTAATSSIVDNSWLDLPTNAYRSPVRVQMAGDVVDDEVLVDDEAVPSSAVPFGEHSDDVLPAPRRRGLGLRG